MNTTFSNRFNKLKYPIIVLVLLVIIILQALFIIKGYKAIYNNNVVSYDRAKLEILFLIDNLKTTDIYSEENGQTVMSEREAVDIYNKLTSTESRMWYISSMIIPINKKSSYIMDITSKLYFTLSNLSYQFLDNKNVTYSDVRGLIDELQVLNSSMEASITLGSEPSISLTENQMDAVLQQLDKLAKYNIKD